MRTARHLLRDEGGASAAEFALVLPLLLILLFGTIDVGRYVWSLSQASMLSSTSSSAIKERGMMTRSST